MPQQLIYQLIYTIIIAGVKRMDNSIARVITRLARKSQSYISFALRQYNISAAEQPFFMALQHHEGVTQEELTTIVSVDKAVTTRAVKSLEEKGYLIRVQDEQDRRYNRIYPTDAAKRLANSVRSELLHFNDLLTQGIDPQSLDIIFAGLQKMEENFSQMATCKEAAKDRGDKEDAANQ